MKNRILFIIFLLASVVLKSQTGIAYSDLKGMDDKINNFLKTWDINGAGVAITKNGKLIYNKGFGFSDRQKSRPALPDDLYRIASVSKPITSIAIMKLIQEGKLAISDTVFGKNKILDQPYYASVITDNRIYSITIQNLLEHTAGWDRSIPCDGYSHSDAPFFPLHVTSVLEESNPVGDSTLIKFCLFKGLNNDPGTNYAYSNIGYLILGKVIEKITGMKYEVYVENNIFKPLGISDIHLGKNFLINAQEREAEYVCSDYTRSCYGDNTKVQSQYGGFNLEAMNAHGGWIASAANLTKLILAVDGSVTSPDILSPEIIKVMSEPGAVNKNYAKGWFINSDNIWWHTGSIDGSSSYICKTNDGYTWAFLFNSRSDNSDAFWEALDRLPWNCLKTVNKIPEINLFPPSINVSDISATIQNSDTAQIKWKNGDGDGRIIIATESEGIQNFPLDGSDYKAGSTFGSGTKLGTRTFVVYIGKENNCILTNLDPAKTYVISGFEYYKNKNTGYQTVYKLGAEEKKIIATNPVFVEDF